MKIFYPVGYSFSIHVSYRGKNRKIVGKPLKDLHISVVAGASWTSDAFNKALDVAHKESSIQSTK